MRMSNASIQTNYKTGYLIEIGNNIINNIILRKDCRAVIPQWQRNRLPLKSPIIIFTACHLN